MTCTFDPELLSLFAGNDLSAEEHRAVAAHLATCPECAASVRHYRAMGGALAAGMQATPVPRTLALTPKRPQPWRTVAVALVALTLVACTAPALVRWFRIERLTVDEVRQLLDESTDRPATAWVFASDQQILDTLGRPLLEADYLPDGFERKQGVIIRSEREPVGFSRLWETGFDRIWITQYRTGKAIDYKLFEGTSTRQVSINGAEGLLIEGTGWGKRGGGGLWQPIEHMPNTGLVFVWKDQLIWITYTAIRFDPKGWPAGITPPAEPPVLTPDELIKIAESLR